MRPDLNLMLAGFGGQGLLFAGKVTAYAGLVEGREISWLPSYGPEMRGGTANCSVCVSDNPIGSITVNGKSPRSVNISTTVAGKSLEDYYYLFGGKTG
ncbi:MAG: 2-oxoacid:acceptor oxidoreductase family protein, partial [Oscillospiraceae bacterium]|nr:2-oxoacid:acceptor oxidoreductase family protein [Oscillospiraceae bacterium]